jgi:hypothetical protein
MFLAGCGEQAGQKVDSPTAVLQMPGQVGTKVVEIPGAFETASSQHTAAVMFPTMDAQTKTAVALLPTSTPVPLPPTPELVGENDFGIWSYKAYRGREGQLLARVEADLGSLEALFAYQQVNQELAKELAAEGGMAEVQITFNTYVKPNEFRVWAREMDLLVDESVLRHKDGFGQDATLGVGAQNDDPLPQEWLDHALASSREHSGEEGEILGVYYTSGKIDAARLPELGSYPTVFIADVTINVIRNDLTVKGIRGGDQALSIADVPPVFFWQMESKYGLDKFKK